MHLIGILICIVLVSYPISWFMRGVAALPERETNLPKCVGTALALFVLLALATIWG